MRAACSLLTPRRTPSLAPCFGRTPLPAEASSPPDRSRPSATDALTFTSSLALALPEFPDTGEPGENAAAPRQPVVVIQPGPVADQALPLGHWLPVAPRRSSGEGPASPVQSTQTEGPSGLLPRGVLLLSMLPPSPEADRQAAELEQAAFRRELLIRGGSTLLSAISTSGSALTYHFIKLAVERQRRENPQASDAPVIVAGLLSVVSAAVTGVLLWKNVRRAWAIWEAQPVDPAPSASAGSDLENPQAPGQPAG